MANYVLVTRVQRDAARMIVKHNEAKGQPVSSAVRRIADATPYNPAVEVTPSEVEGTASDLASERTTRLEDDVQ